MTVKRAVIALMPGCGHSVSDAAPDTAVRVSRVTSAIPTYAEGPVNTNPTFDLFTVGRFNYPYPICDARPDRRQPVSWRSLHLESEYLGLALAQPAMASQLPVHDRNLSHVLARTALRGGVPAGSQ